MVKGVLKLMSVGIIGIFLLTTACGKNCNDQQTKKGSWPSEKCEDNSVVAAVRTDPSQLSYLPNGTYTSSSLNWCTNGACNSAGQPGACGGIYTFGDVGGDFTVYGDTSATFWSSIAEAVSMNLDAQRITLTTNDTGHVGYSFTFVYLGGSPAQWEVTYGTNCGRLYQCHLGACL